VSGSYFVAVTLLRGRNTRSVQPLATDWWVRISNQCVGERFFSRTPIHGLSSTHPPLQWVPEFFSGGKAAGVWCWPLFSN